MTANNYLIYKHTSPSGKAYIGQTKDYKTRTSKHKNCKSGSIAFANAIKKYTWDAFTHEILHENLTLDQANTLEELSIIEYNTLFPNGYNIRAGGNNYKISDETRIKISNTLKGRSIPEDVKLKMIELRRRPENRLAASIKQTGKKQSDATKLKKSIAAKGRIISGETRMKMRSKLIGRKLTTSCIQNRTFAQAKVKFLKELSLYNQYIINLPNLTIFKITELRKLLNLSYTPLKNRIHNNEFPNHYLIESSYNPQIRIPIIDIHNYYAKYKSIYDK